MTTAIRPATRAGFLLLCFLLASAGPASGGLASGAAPILNACAGKPEPDYWIKRLTAPDPRTRSLAASALGEMRARTAVLALIRALDDGDARVRRAVVEALGQIGPAAKAAIAALTRALSDDDPEVRVKARHTLERIGAR